MINFNSKFEQSELRTYCKNEGLQLTDILAEAKKTEKKKRKIDFMLILNFIRTGRENNKPVIFGVE